ncbi:MAG: multicopper oxidase domain-containing protein, partial [Steroidobacteraceae bacterium]|nr:multicopper oxidase domain-containing protein [Deltaproteobacteria bacterium]
MKTRSTTNVWRCGLMLILLCIWNIPHLAGAGTAPPIPTGPLDANGNPSVPDYYTTANWANSPPLAKFVDTLPGLGSGKANTLGQYLSVGKPDIVTYPGSDYYEIDLVEYRERMHSDLPAPGTLLRGYVQVNKGTDTASCGGTTQPACSTIHNTLNPDLVHQLGPTLVAQRDRPVRIKFTNKLPIGPSGDLFIPVDTSVMGAGTGPASASATRGVGAPCDNTVEPNACASYTQNRSAIHLHGGRTPWISDGTPHQWITPAGEITPFTKGVSLQNVPDMPDPGDGSTTYYYTNQQSARLMFYHEHAFGITRLNPYVGVAAGYVITDQWEQDLVTRGIIPADQIPLIIQDKTFVDATPVIHPVTGQATTQVRVTDPLWNWGSGTPDATGVRPPVTGDLWLPHVYMPAQTLAAGFGGVNPFGRWMYGPWFYPATAVEKGPVTNPYYDADCSSPFPAVYANCTTPGQPTKIPGTPHPSMGMEAFQDSVVVNGTAFPSLTVDPRAYRFRILNAASDRFQNLSFYVADTTLANTSPDARTLSPYTEVKTVTASAALAAANNWPADWPIDGRDGGVPDPGICTGAGATLSCTNLGPSFLQIGTEGGFLPQTVTIAPQPVTYITDPTAFWVGIVDKTGLALGPAERADVIVDFSAYAGKTLILYNDAPAAWPARVAGYDYYTGAPDMRDSGGYGTGGTFDPITGAWVGGTGPLAGYAPNTRTVMQVIVRPTLVDPPNTYSQAALAAEFTAAATPTVINPAPVKTLFERAQEPIIVGQAAYSTAYPNSYFPPNFPWEGVNQINDHFLNFVTLAGQPVQMPTEPKGIHDEMGASFDPVYGRMSGNLGMQLPNPTTLNANLILYGFSDIPTETVINSTTVNVQVLGSDPALIPWQVTDGTQIWKISHNGVDTHPIHFHIFDVQLVNRVGWDGQTMLPEPNELGWKDTVKISPLMDTIVAVRPRAPALPFGIANSLRPLNPAIPLDSPMGFNSVDWTTGQARVPAVTNILYDFGWEYVWHCHILSHEEMDMMRPIVLNVVSTVPGAPVLSASSLSLTQADLSWSDPTPVNYATGAGFGDPAGEIGFRIERAVGNGPFSVLRTVLANSTTFSDLTVAANTMYRYQVVAFNAAGDSISNIVVFGQPIPVAPATPSNLVATAGPAATTPAPVSLTWTDNADNETGFTIQRATDAAFTLGLTTFTVGANVTAFSDITAAAATTYFYRVAAVNAVGNSAWSNTAQVT